MYALPDATQVAELTTIPVILAEAMSSSWMDMSSGIAQHRQKITGTTASGQVVAVGGVMVGAERFDFGIYMGTFAHPPLFILCSKFRRQF